MRTFKLLVSIGIVLALLVGGLAVSLVGPTTLRHMDLELLWGLPAGIIELSKSPATVAERQAAGGPLRYVERYIPGADGDPPVRIVIVEPKDAAPGRAGILDIHGGGFAHGSPELSLTTLVEGLVLRLGITAVSVDYRLAPGTRYPGSLRDNYAALEWFQDNAQDLGVDRTRIATMGFSAGGYHAAALGLHARDRGGPPILCQVLLSPALDDRTGSGMDPGETRGRFLWSREDNRKAWTAFLGVEAGTEQVPAEAVPMRVTDLSGLPPTFISVGSLDLFATESESFAQKLKAAGVATELHVFPGGFHGFEVLSPSAELSQRALGELESYLAEMFRKGKSPHPTEEALADTRQ